MAERGGPGSRVTSLVIPTPYQVTYTNQSAGIVRGTGADWFGPLNPMNQTAPPEVYGRQMDFPSGYNLNQQPRAYEPITFADLRGLADSFDLLRIIIETRKDQVSRMKWAISKREKNPVKGGKIKQAIPEDDARIDELETFLRKPDGQHRWTDWLRSLLEDLFVIDAPTVLKMRTRGGKIMALRQLDGATIKRVIDDWGQTPLPYKQNGVTYNPPAYQQCLKGMPAVDYTARDLIYMPRNARVHKVYGFSPVEQIIMTVNIALRRQVYQLAYYTEGNVPESLIGAPDSWNPDQIKAFQIYWDEMLSGNLASRRRAKFIPGGVAKTFIPTKEPELTGKTDEWLARVVCYCFSISPQSFVSMMNRGTAETAHDASLEEGLGPVLLWVKEMMDEVLETELDAKDYEFKWQTDAEVDPEKQQKIVSGLVDDGLLTGNEGRDVIGYERSDNPAMDIHMVKTATGMVPVDANTIEGKKAMAEAFPAPEPTELGPDGKPLPPKPVKAKDDKTGEVGKHANAPFVKKKVLLKPLNEERALVQRHRTSLRNKVAAGLRDLGKHVAAQARLLLRAELGKAKDEEDNTKANALLAASITDRLDLDGLDFMIDATQEDLEAVAADSARSVLAQLGVTDNEDLVNQVNERAVKFAKDRSAELIGKSYDDDGNLVDAVNAEYRIDDTTRDLIRQTIANGLDENLGLDEIAAELEDSFGFSEERADLIARTEISRANSEGALEAAREARDEGISVKKVWQLAPDYEDQDDDGVCQDNADDGPIDLDEDFSSGDSTVPAHPNCRCVMTFETEDGGDTGDGEED